MGIPSDDRAQAAPESGVGTALDGALFRKLFLDAASLLQRHVQALNAINVYPVPDGDTGTNMYLTLRAAVDELAAARAVDLTEASRALAQGALMGARGNSGVILSQVLRGFATALDGRSVADGEAMIAALSAASDAAYAALEKPVEGTILTVARHAADAVAQAAPATVEEALQRAVSAARDAVAQTPELLPVLKEAGVVDAGGLGLAIVLEGLLRSLRGDPLDVDLAPEAAGRAGWRGEAASLHHAEHGETGYCTEFMVSAVTPDPAAVRQHLHSLGDSLLVVGGDGLLRVHVHTTRPDDALAYGRTLGEISHIKVDNMEAQMERFASDAPAAPLTPTIGIVAVAAGAGIEAAFRSVGVTHLVEGGQTMNPSAGQILEAIERCPEENVIVLPNNKNIIAAAEQAAGGAAKHVVVLPSRSIPQGVAAVLALNPDLPFEANAAAMARALSSVRSAEVTRAVRATVTDGRRIEMGEAIGVIDGALRVVAADIAGAVLACAEEMCSPDASLLTLYAGQDVRVEDARRRTAADQADHPQRDDQALRHPPASEEGVGRRERA